MISVKYLAWSMKIRQGCRDFKKCSDRVDGCWKTEGLRVDSLDLPLLMPETPMESQARLDQLNMELMKSSIIIE